MKKEIFAWLLGLMLCLPACRGPIKNAAALTPLPTLSPAKYPTATIIPSPSVPPTPPPIIVIHQVQAGDTLFGISQQYNADIEAIRALNGVQDNTIFAGQELKIPQPSPHPPTPLSQ